MLFGLMSFSGSFQYFKFSIEHFIHSVETIRCDGVEIILFNDILPIMTIPLAIHWLLYILLIIIEIVFQIVSLPILATYCARQTAVVGNCVSTAVTAILDCRSGKYF